jgi:hypothetical protein
MRLWLTWALTAGAVVVLFSLDLARHALLDCELVAGSSVYGEVVWRPHLLGPACAYDVDGVRYVDEPSRLRWVLVAAFAIWAASIRRATRSR